MNIPVIEKVMKLNDDIAASVRERLQNAGVTAINMISAPGSGKTTLIEAALQRLSGIRATGVIEGDPETSLDAERIAKFDVPVVQLNTAGGCHLEANLVNRALDQLPLSDLELLVIENVGNLVCPVEFDLGEQHRVAVVSVTEGHDKPAKYPKLFRKAGLVVLNKTDLLPYVDFDRSYFHDTVRMLNPAARMLDLSCKTGEGVDQWVDWLIEVAPHRNGQAPRNEDAYVTVPGR